MGKKTRSDFSMRSGYRRHLDISGNYEVPVNSIYVVRPDINIPDKIKYTEPHIPVNTIRGNTFTTDTSNPVIQNSKKKKIPIIINNRITYKNGGSIHISPSKRGTFTAAATKHGMGVQEFASKVLRNKEDYSPSLVKKANFARNASKWNK